jgi:hypothetical protein
MPTPEELGHPLQSEPDHGGGGRLRGLRGAGYGHGGAVRDLSPFPCSSPVIVHLGFDPIWFGIIIVCVVEIGLISPPVGMNMFVLKTLLPR